MGIERKSEPPFHQALMWSRTLTIAVPPAQIIADVCIGATAEMVSWSHGNRRNIDALVFYHGPRKGSAVPRQACLAAA